MTSMDGYTLEDDPDDNNMFDDSGFLTKTETIFGF